MFKGLTKSFEVTSDNADLTDNVFNPRLQRRVLSVPLCVFIMFLLSYETNASISGRFFLRKLIISGMFLRYKKIIEKLNKPCRGMYQIIFKMMPQQVLAGYLVSDFSSFLAKGRRFLQIFRMPNLFKKYCVYRNTIEILTIEFSTVVQR